MMTLNPFMHNIEKWSNIIDSTVLKMRFSMKDFFSKCDQIRRKLWIWSHLMKKSLMENLIFCVVCPYTRILTYFTRCRNVHSHYFSVGFQFHLKPTLHEKCSYSGFFWSVFSRIRSRKTPNTDTFYVVQSGT